jgi:hypothetical protein
MSSSRSIAAARQRRAGEAPPVGQQQRGPATSINSQKAFAQQQIQQPNQQQIYQQQNGNQPVPQVPVGKLAIGDAFALVTIRLGRIESIIQKLEAEGVIGPNAKASASGSESTMEHDENMRLVDDTVIRNIIARLGDLEKTQPKTLTKEERGLNEREVSSVVNQTTSHLLNQVIQLKNELKETKEMLTKLQSFSIETNQKVTNITATQEKHENLLSALNKPISSENLTEEENVDEEEVVNLKTIINSDLSNINIEGDQESDSEVEEGEEEN